jgi:hypothetical protein
MLARGWFRVTAGQYQKRTYSHAMRITNLRVDIMWLIGKGHCELHQVQLLASMLSGSAVAYPLATGYATHRGLPALHGAGSKALRILRKEADAH